MVVRMLVAFSGGAEFSLVTVMVLRVLLLRMRLLRMLWVLRMLLSLRMLWVQVDTHNVLLLPEPGNNPPLDMPVPIGRVLVPTEGALVLTHRNASCQLL